MLSATLPTLSPSTGIAVVQQSAPVQVQSASVAQATAGFSTIGSIAPSTVLTGTNSTTGNHKSTGCVAFALYRPANTSAKVGGSAVNVPIALLISSSSAKPSQPDKYNTTVTVSLTVKDAASGKWAKVSFTATMTGTMSYLSSSVKLTFQGALTRQVKLGNHTYTVSLKSQTIAVPAPGTTPVPLTATVKVS